MMWRRETSKLWTHHKLRRLNFHNLQIWPCNLRWRPTLLQTSLPWRQFPKKNVSVVYVFERDIIRPSEPDLSSLRLNLVLRVLNAAPPPISELFLFYLFRVLVCRTVVSGQTAAVNRQFSRTLLLQLVDFVGLTTLSLSVKMLPHWLKLYNRLWTRDRWLGPVCHDFTKIIKVWRRKFYDIY